MAVLVWCAAAAGWRQQSRRVEGATTTMEPRMSTAMRFLFLTLCFTWRQTLGVEEPLAAVGAAPRMGEGARAVDKTAGSRTPGIDGVSDGSTDSTTNNTDITTNNMFGSNTNPPVRALVLSSAHHRRLAAPADSTEELTDATDISTTAVSSFSLKDEHLTTSLPIPPLPRRRGRRRRVGVHRAEMDVVSSPSASSVQGSREGHR